MEILKGCGQKMGIFNQSTTGKICSDF